MFGVWGGGGGGVLWDCCEQWGLEDKRVDTATPYGTDAYYF